MVSSCHVWLDCDRVNCWFPRPLVVDAQDTNLWKTHDGSTLRLWSIVLILTRDMTDSRAAPPGRDVKQDSGMQATSQDRVKNSDNPAPTPVDLADEVKGMYRLLDLISESGSNGYGKDSDPSRPRRDGSSGT